MTTRRTLLRSAAALATGTALTGTAVARRRRNGGGSGDRTTDDSTDDTSATDLTDVERDGLHFMREEEKLAHDVYLVLYREWGLTVFENIADSETTHVEAMEDLLELYNLDDPAVDAVGEFTNDELQTMYDDLVARGRTSELEALRVGALIEETDIVDISDLIEGTDEDAIERVYGNLLDGSENHLRAFVRVLDRYGVDYEPVVLDRATFDRIVDA